MNCEKAEELITALVDGQLAESERGELENHFKGCTPCRFALAQERNLKKAIFAAGSELRAPAALKESLLNDPRLFATPAPRLGYMLRLNLRRRGAAFALAASLAVVGASWLLRSPSPAIALAAVSTYSQAFEAGPLTVQSADLRAVINALTAMVQARFKPMGYDFAMMQIQPTGGALRTIAGREVLVTRYLGPSHALLCYTFLGDESDAPAGAAVFHDAAKGLDFYAFSLGDVNAVLHRENGVICILASKMATNELLDLARAKAAPHRHL